MIFINRKERFKTVSGLFPSPCQTIWNWSHFTNLSSFHALIARSDSLQSRVSIYSTIHHHLLACFLVQMLTSHPIFYIFWMKISLSTSFQSVATLWWNQHLGKHCPSPPFPSNLSFPKIGYRPISLHFTSLLLIFGDYMNRGKVSSRAIWKTSNLLYKRRIEVETCRFIQ